MKNRLWFPFEMVGWWLHFLVRAQAPAWPWHLGPAARGPGLALAPRSPRAHQRNAATIPPSRREIIDDSSIFGQSFNHTPNHNLNHNSNHNLNMFPAYVPLRPSLLYTSWLFKTNGAAPCRFVTCRGLSSVSYKWYMTLGSKLFVCNKMAVTRRRSKLWWRISHRSKALVEL